MTIVPTKGRLPHASHQPFQERAVDCNRSNMAEHLAWLQPITSLYPLLAFSAGEAALVSVPVLWLSHCPAEQNTFSDR
jgi:hypothetical protein